MRYFHVLALLCLTLVVGCSSNPRNRELSEARHYREAQELLERKSWLTAIDSLEEIEARFPYGDYAEQVQLDLIHARFKSLDYPEAVAQADRFIRSYPTHQHLDYVLYMKGLANFYLELGLFDRLSETDKASRDLDAMRDAFADFDQLIQRFPESPYAADARQRMVHIRNLLAEQELRAANYYARRRAFIAAANRAQFVVRHYQESPAVPEALAILSKSYESLEQPELARKSQTVLAANWPSSPYLDEDGNVTIEWWPRDERRWLRLITFDLLK